MGFMPNSLYKGTIGLRLDFLSRYPSVRLEVATRLEAGESPLTVVSDIHAKGIKIDALNDSKADFIKKLNFLNSRDEIVDPSHDRSGRVYHASDAHLHPRNQDSGGNRKAFLQYWIDNGDQALINVMRTELLKALNSTHKRIDFYWDCSLHTPSAPTVLTVEMRPVVRVLFRTDTRPEEKDETLGKRDPDAEPADLDEEFQPPPG